MYVAITERKEYFLYPFYTQQYTEISKRCYNKCNIQKNKCYNFSFSNILRRRRHEWRYHHVRRKLLTPIWCFINELICKKQKSIDYWQPCLHTDKGALYMFRETYMIRVHNYVPGNKILSNSSEIDYCIYNINHLI